MSCANPSRPNYQYFPNMYEPIGYETYADTDAFANGIEAQIPVEGTVARGWEPYDYPDTNEGYEAAKANLISPLEKTDQCLKRKRTLRDLLCRLSWKQRGWSGHFNDPRKISRGPSYADREITNGSIYHVLMYGKNAMGSHAGQVNAEERWQIAQHVMELRSKLVK